MRAALAVAGVACWLVLLAGQAALGSWVLSSEVVAGLISPQGATLSGLAAVGAFMVARVLAVLALPGVVASLVTFAILGAARRRPRR